MPDTISAAEFLKRIKKGEACCVADIRTDGEYNKCRLKSPTIHVPMDRLDAGRIRAIRGESGKTVYLLCKSGGRTRYAVEKLRKQGVKNILSVDGGLIACLELGAETDSGS